MVSVHIIKLVHQHHEMEEGDKAESKSFPFRTVIQKLHVPAMFIFLVLELGHMAAISCRAKLRDLMAY